jgi:hypothetical protein
MAELLHRRTWVVLAIALLAVLAACGDDGGGDPEGSSDPTEQDDDSGDEASDDDEGSGDEGSGDEGGDDDGSDDEVEPLEPAELPAEVVPFAEALAVAFATDSAFSSVDEVQAQCLSTNVVAIIGAERLAASGLTPEQFGTDPDLTAVGIVRSDAEAIYDVFAGCGLDYRAAIIDGILLEAADVDGVRPCVEDVLDDAIVRELAIAALLGGIDDSPDTSEALADLQACTTPDEG